MKKIKKLLFVIILLGVVFCFRDVYAEDPYVMIGTHKIISGYDDDLYGGHVKLTDTELVLDGVSINEVYTYDHYTYGTDFSAIYINDMVLDIKLVRDNYISSVGVGNPCYKVNPDDDTVTKKNIHAIRSNYVYNGDYNDEVLNIEDYDDYDNYKDLIYRISGSGSITMNFDNYSDYFGIDVGLLNIGEINNQGPTININYGATLTYSCAIYGINRVYNSNLNYNVSSMTMGYLIGCTSLDEDYSFEIYNSNLNFNVHTTCQSYLIHAEKDSLLKNCNLNFNIIHEISEIFPEDYEDIKPYITAYAGYLTFEDCNIYTKAPSIFSEEAYRRTTITIKKSSNGNVDNFFDGIMNATLNIENISNDMIYTSTTTRDALSLNPPYDSTNLENYKFLHIKSSNNYDVLSGNNQKINGNEFIFKLNAPKIFLSGLYLDDVLLDLSDYNYDYDGTVTFTSSGLNKIKELSNGPHKIQARYVNDKTVDVDFEVGEGSTLNPDTIDYVLVYFFSLFVSIVCIFTVLKVIRKKSI